MRSRQAYALKVAAAILTLLVLPACTSLRAIEPVIAPPAQFQLDRVVAVDQDARRRVLGEPSGVDRGMASGGGDR